MSIKFLGISVSAMIGISSLLPGLAQAGFEWVPPQQIPQAPKDDLDQSARYNSMTQDMMDVTVPSAIAIPAAPVMSEPLGIVESKPTRSSAEVFRGPSSSTNDGRVKRLIIDPYPMEKSNQSHQHKRPVSDESVYKGMNEEAKISNPLPLGPNMSTMAKPVRIASTNQKIDKPINTNTSITPLPSGIVTPELPVIEYAEAVGFGRELPLALAMSQVVPSDYAFSFSDDSAAGEIVSWQGGKPWDQVLNDMLAGQGLRAIIQGKKVTIAAL